MFQVRSRLTAVTLATASAALGIASLAAESRPGDATTASAPALATYLVVYTRGNRGSTVGRWRSSRDCGSISRTTSLCIAQVDWFRQVG